MSRSFDGSDDRILFGDSISAPNTLSVFCWCRPTNTSPGNTRAIMAKGIGATGNREYGLLMANGGAAVGILADESTSDVDFKVADTVMSQDVWQFVGYTWSGSSIQMYFNGSTDGNVASSIGAGNIEDLAAELKFGDSEDTNVEFPGILAHFHIYDRVLSQAEIRQIMYLPASVTRNLRGYWSLWGLASAEPEMSGKQINGTITGPIFSSLQAPTNQIYTPQSPMMHGAA